MRTFTSLSLITGDHLIPTVHPFRNPTNDSRSFRKNCASRNQGPGEFFQIQLPHQFITSLSTFRVQFELIHRDVFSDIPPEPFIPPRRDMKELNPRSWESLDDIGAHSSVIDFICDLSLDVGRPGPRSVDTVPPEFT
ncbi:uncharacterized protein EKO05_0001805 [Ascochyta rabiei]|uniref:uncharacterized protein n=1 Tax=Didymella rabiei TaxID=5454 RepID=UPI0022087E17|nr:uncharacterized protein EKO05_0001805 [Ascochyta rabiei]UPX11183.1 hypothetical protein EKO05_0001805 [Ascochyta rabiei]